jgi:hypothetical protein
MGWSGVVSKYCNELKPTTVIHSNNNPYMENNNNNNQSVNPRPEVVNISGQKFVKTSDTTLINLQHIRWVKKIDRCLEICNKMDGCTAGRDTHPVCQYNNPEVYAWLNKYFL